MSFILLSSFYSISIDCQHVLNLAAGLQMRFDNSTLQSQFETDCCLSSTITCSNNKVKELDWSFMNLNGSINGSAIPRELSHLRLGTNSIHGDVPLLLSTYLINVAIPNNKLNGTIKGFYSQLLGLALFGNQLSGSLSDTSSIISLNVQENRFSGELVLAEPRFFFIQRNDFTKLSIGTSSIINCDISNNPLLGHPSISNLGMCTQFNLYKSTLTLDVYSASFTSYLLLSSSLEFATSTTGNLNNSSLEFTSLTAAITATNLTHSISELPSSHLISQLPLTSPTKAQTTSIEVQSIKKLTRRPNILSTTSIHVVTTDYIISTISTSQMSTTIMNTAHSNPPQVLFISYSSIARLLVSFYTNVYFIYKLHKLYTTKKPKMSATPSDFDN